MMTLSLPIPKPKAEKTFFYLPYKIGKGYVNYSYKIKVGESDNMRTLRSIMKDTYGLDPGSFVVSTVYNNNFSRLHTSSANLLDVTGEQGATLLYQIDPSLSPSMPSQALRLDNMYNLPPEVTMLQLNLSLHTLQSRYGQRSMAKTSMLPRLLWVRKSMTMKELHLEVFKTVRQVFSEWAKYADPNCKRENKADQASL